jgi:hypothetical protein
MLRHVLHPIPCAGHEASAERRLAAARMITPSRFSNEAAMHTVMVSLPRADLAEVMSAMRAWLDEHRVQPSVFRHDVIGGDKLLLKLDSTIAIEARDFALPICNSATEPGRRPAKAASLCAILAPAPIARRTKGRAGRGRALLRAERKASRTRTQRVCGAASRRNRREWAPRSNLLRVVT